MKLTPFCSDSFLLSNEYIISLIALLVVEKFGCDQVPSVAGFLITYSRSCFNWLRHLKCITEHCRVKREECLMNTKMSFLSLKNDTAVVKPELGRLYCVRVVGGVSGIIGDGSLTLSWRLVVLYRFHGGR